MKDQFNTYKEKYKKFHTKSISTVQLMKILKACPHYHATNELMGVQAFINPWFKVDAQADNKTASSTSEPGNAIRSSDMESNNDYVFIYTSFLNKSWRCQLPYKPSLRCDSRHQQEEQNIKPMSQATPKEAPNPFKSYEEYASKRDEGKAPGARDGLKFEMLKFEQQVKNNDKGVELEEEKFNHSCSFNYAKTTC
ncbi:hypothetical protein VP01_1905g5 [Puccinia sorghi]|uniref:Uncharacterized protein n=1 Tax=Puccinia sorghi TaxID=27349 RepID=A0A0L6VCT3_9BASI|nr:hypothetical protein VP01_1905g5 [Puccinia sorghi]